MLRGFGYIIDGVFARSTGGETKLRRAADAVIDRASQAVVAREVARQQPETRPYLATMLAGEVIGSAAYGVLAARGICIHSLGIAAASLKVFSAYYFLTNAIHPKGEVNAIGIREI